MALIKCDECWADMSGKADACPKCGNPVLAARGSGTDSSGGHRQTLRCLRAIRAQGFWGRGQKPKGRNFNRYTLAVLLSLPIVCSAQDNLSCRMVAADVRMFADDYHKGVPLTTELKRYGNHDFRRSLIRKTYDMSENAGMAPEQIQEAAYESCGQSSSSEPQKPKQTRQIPLHCNDPETLQDATVNIPNALDLGPDAAEITGVKFMSDVPRVMFYPAVNGQSPLFMLECPVTVSFSNGFSRFGWFEEWTDHYGQIKVYFGQQPVTPQAN